MSIGEFVLPVCPGTIIFSVVVLALIVVVSLCEMLATVPNGGGDGPPKRIIVEFVDPGDKPERDKP